jgi:hypothetical protein
VLTNVRFGSLADIGVCPRDVRFTPESGHWESAARFPLCAKSGQFPTKVRGSKVISGAAGQSLPNDKKLFADMLH